MGEAAPRQKLNTRALHLGEYLRCMGAATTPKGDADIGRAVLNAEHRHALHVMPVLKAAQDAGSTGGAWGSQLAPVQQFSDGLLSSLRNFGVFDAALANGFKIYPLNTSSVAVTTGAVGYTVAEGTPKPVTPLSLQ